jgi:hypothetical protein
MKAVFRVANRLRSGAPIPRDFLPIKGIEHLGLCYRQQIITDPAEFNAMQAAIADPRFPSRGAKIEAYALTESDEQGMAAVELATPEADAEPEAEVATETDAEPEVEAATETDAPAPAESTMPSYNFRREGDDILMGDERVAGIYENGLRCSKGYADLRASIETWLNSQPE